MRLDHVSYTDLTGDGAPEAIVVVQDGGDDEARAVITRYFVFEVKDCTLLHRPAVETVGVSRTDGGAVFTGMMLGSKLRTHQGKIILTHDVFRRVLA
jgi:hypothetical protein